MNKLSSIIDKCATGFAFFVFITFFSGCMTYSSDRPLIFRRPGVAPDGRSGASLTPQDSSMAASLQLTNQGRELLQNDRIDDAVSVLERSINLDPKNGESYYYLAEAWLLKGDLGQAQQFNRLAALYCRNDPNLTILVNEQSETIGDRK
jgi:tetratricopeptide (TPR) repeat protein